MAMDLAHFLGVDPMAAKSASSPLLLIVLTILFAVYKAYQSFAFLKHIPGPPLAAFTNLVRRSWVLPGNVHQKHTDLHRQYGTVIRVGPRAVLVSAPTAIDQIYGFKTRFQKSEFYDAIMPRMKGGKIPDVFATRDENIHRQMRRPIANLYSVANLMRFESHVTSTIEFFFSRIDELFLDQSASFDLANWIQLFTFDVMGQVTFSRRLGFLEKGGDIEDVMENNWKFFKSVAANTQMPWLDIFWKDNPLIPVSAKKNPLAEFGAARIKERSSLADHDREKIDDQDFLSCFIKEKDRDPTLPELALPTWTNSNIQAGGDTTSIMASVVLYHLLKQPSSLARLQAEIDVGVAEGRISKITTWKEAQSMEYLDACVKEASRIHPPIGFPLERIVPTGGIVIDGNLIPAGTRISMNPWAVHREPGLFGDDPDVWRPERWLCDDAQKKAMYNSLLTFGAGHRSCLGKNLSYIEIYKLIPSLLQRYEIQLKDPEEEWTLENKWFIMPSGIHVRMTKREV